VVLPPLNLREMSELFSMLSKERYESMTSLCGVEGSGHPMNVTFIVNLKSDKTNFGALGHVGCAECITCVSIAEKY
jgi:hypothetical protein